nr:hypothetical protein [Hyphomonas sp. Mor2]
MDEIEPETDAPEVAPRDRWPVIADRHIRTATAWVESHAFSSIALCLAPAGLAVLFPQFWIQCLCLIWGLINLTFLGRVMLTARDMPSGRRLIISFASVIAVTQMFGAAYAATLLSGDSFRHFRFSDYSPAADFNNRRLAAEILADSHASSVKQLNAYVKSMTESGKPPPNDYPYDARLTARPCPSLQVSLFMFHYCDETDPIERSPKELYKAERWFDDIFKIEKFSEHMWILRSDDSRNSAVAALEPVRPKATFFDYVGSALMTYVYQIENEQREAPTRADRRALIEYLADIAKTTLRDFGGDNESLIPSEMALTYNRGVSRIEYAVADALLCAQYPRPDYNEGTCVPVPEFQPLVSEDGWDAPDAKPGVVMAGLHPLDLVLKAYLTELLYWEIKQMEDTNDRRDLVINGFVFSAMAVMTSGFSDMSPTSYLAKSLLIFQFLAYVLLIILILPMSFERPKEEL